MGTYDLFIPSAEGNWTNSNGTWLSTKPILHRSLADDQVNGLLTALAFVRKEGFYLLIKNSTEIVFNEYVEGQSMSEDEYREAVSDLSAFQRGRYLHDPYVGFISRTNEEGEKIYWDFFGTIGVFQGVYEILNLFNIEPETHLEVYEQVGFDPHRLYRTRQFGLEGEIEGKEEKEEKPEWVRYPLELINYPSLNPLQRIPREILYQIVDRLDPREISRLCQTTSEFRDICRDNPYWKRRLIRDFDLLPESVDELPESAFDRYRKIYRERKRFSYSSNPFEQAGYLGDVLFAFNFIDEELKTSRDKYSIFMDLRQIGRGIIRSDNLKLFIRVFPRLVELYLPHRRWAWNPGEELIGRLLPDDDFRYDLNQSLKILEYLLSRYPNLQNSILISTTESSSIKALDFILTRYPEFEKFIPKLIEYYVRSVAPILFLAEKYGDLFDEETWKFALFKVAGNSVEDLPKLLGNPRFPRELIPIYLDVYRVPVLGNERAAEILKSFL